MKQTAVQWLIDELTDNGIDYLDLAYVIINQAKEMERQQIIEAHGLIAKLQEDGSHKLISGETYYNETYKPSA
jgi:hypothetical protein